MIQARQKFPVLRTKQRGLLLEVQAGVTEGRRADGVGAGSSKGCPHGL